MGLMYGYGRMMVTSEATKLRMHMSILSLLNNTHSEDIIFHRVIKTQCVSTSYIS